jgi:hypothetical protein
MDEMDYLSVILSFLDSFLLHANSPSFHFVSQSEFGGYDHVILLTFVKLPLVAIWQLVKLTYLPLMTIHIELMQLLEFEVIYRQ